MEITIYEAGQDLNLPPESIGMRATTALGCNLKPGEPVVLTSYPAGHSRTVRLARWHSVANDVIGPQGCLVWPEVLRTLAVASGERVVLSSGKRPRPEFFQFCWIYDESSEPRLPEDLLVILDTSSSMEGLSMAAAKSALLRFVEKKRELSAELGVDDALGLITFGGDGDIDVRVACPFVSLAGSNRKLFTEAVLRAVPNGITPMRAALEKAGEELDKIPDSGPTLRRKRLILVTDGHPCPGSPDEVLDVVNKLEGQGVCVATIGIGDDFNRQLLMKISAITRAPFVEAHQVRELAYLLEKLA